MGSCSWQPQPRTPIVMSNQSVAPRSASFWTPLGWEPWGALLASQHGSPGSWATAGVNRANPGGVVPNSRVPSPIFVSPSRFGMRDPGSKLDESLALHPTDVPNGASSKTDVSALHHQSITNPALPNPIVPQPIDAACRRLQRYTIQACRRTDHGPLRNSIWVSILPSVPLSLSRRYPRRLVRRARIWALYTPLATFCLARPVQPARFSLVLVGRFLRPSLPSFGWPPAPRRGLSHPLCYILPALASPLAANACSTPST